MTDRTPFTKTVRIGHSADTGNTYCKVEFSGGRLSITGVEGPKANGDARGGCGQIIRNPWHFSTYAPGWSPELVAQFRAVWDAWHLNDMQAGSPAQTAWLKAHPVEDRMDHFTKASEALAAAGLNPDPGYLRNGKPYRYGSAWLTGEVPGDVLDFLRGLPDTDTTPAWV